MGDYGERHHVLTFRFLPGVSFLGLWTVVSSWASERTFRSDRGQPTLVSAQQVPYGQRSTRKFCGRNSGLGRRRHSLMVVASLAENWFRAKSTFQPHWVLDLRSQIRGNEDFLGALSQQD